MSALPLSTRSLLDLIDLFERSKQSIADSQGQRLYGVPGWDVAGRTSLSASELGTWTECVGYAGTYPAPCGDGREPVDLEADGDPSRYRYRCAETFRTKYVAASDVAVYAVEPSRLLHFIADLLDIPRALRKGVELPLLDGHLWNLGKARIGPARIDVWIVRGLATSIDAVFRHFHMPDLPDQGLVLSSGNALPGFVRPPKNYRFVPLREIVVDVAPKPCLDMDLLLRKLTTPADGMLPRVLAVHFDEYTKTLTIRTKTTPWVIKGERQAAAVRHMYEQACSDRWWLPAAEILGAAYPDKESGRSLRMQNLFSGNATWEDFIANPKKGIYGFRLA